MVSWSLLVCYCCRLEKQRELPASLPPSAAEAALRSLFVSIHIELTICFYENHHSWRQQQQQRLYHLYGAHAAATHGGSHGRRPSLSSAAFRERLARPAVTLASPLTTEPKNTPWQQHQTNASGSYESCCDSSCRPFPCAECDSRNGTLVVMAFLVAIQRRAACRLPPARADGHSIPDGWHLYVAAIINAIVVIVIIVMLHGMVGRDTGNITS